MVENGCVKPYLSSQGGPEIKYLLYRGMSEKGRLLVKPSGPLGTSLALHQENEVAGHIESTKRKQREMNSDTQLSSSFLLIWQSEWAIRLN